MELWKPIIDYEGLYSVSNMGNVRSNNRILKPSKVKKGYLKVTLCKYGVHKDYRISRLVAIAFIPNPNNLLQVNHKDEIKEHNWDYNLEWCDNDYNASYGSRVKVVLQYDLAMNLINEYPSVCECSRQGYNKSSIIKCCKNILKTSHGYIWRYKND